MTLKNQSPWKLLSIGLLGVIAIGLFAPVQAAPGGAQSGWQVAVAGLQGQIDSLNVDDADSDPTNELQTLGQIDSSFGRFGLDLDDPNDSVSWECFGGYVGKLEISSCPGAVGCSSEDELTISVNCKVPTLSVP